MRSYKKHVFFCDLSYGFADRITNTSTLTIKEEIVPIRELLLRISKKLLTLMSHEASDSEILGVIFLCEQFKLLDANTWRYSVNMLIFSFMIFHQSEPAYSAMRETVCFIRRTCNSFHLSSMSRQHLIKKINIFQL